jgi:hypothetical protein
LQSDSGFKRNILSSDLRHNRHRPERQAQSDAARNNTDKRALEHKQSYNATPLGPQRHAQSDLALASGEAH